MRIAHFAAVLKNEDGVALVLRDLAREAVANGDSVVVVTGQRDKGFSIDAEVILIPSVPLPLYKEYRIPLPGIKGFEKRLKTFQPDIIHIHSPEPSALAAAQYAKKYNIPIVATYHTDFEKYLSYFHLQLFRPLLWSILRSIYKKMAIVTTPSFSGGQQLTDNGIKNSTVIPWGVDLQQFNPSYYSEQWRKEMLGPNEQCILLYVGRLVWYKDIQTLADTYALLQQQRNDIAMVVVGEGPAREALQKRMPYARFLGHKEKDALATAYASSDIFFFPSSTETFGRVTFEAIACNTIPVLADSVGYKAMHAQHNVGVIAQAKNAKSFRDAILSVLDNQDMKTELQKNNTTMAADFAWSSVAQAFSKLYADLIDKKISK